jgi:hypothetical protein
MLLVLELRLIRPKLMLLVSKIFGTDFTMPTLR